MVSFRTMELGLQRLYYVAWACVACIGLAMVGIDSWQTYKQREEYRLVLERCTAAPSPAKPPRPVPEKPGDPVRDSLNERLDGLQEYQDAVARGCALPSPNDAEANDRLLVNLVATLGLLLAPYALMLAIRFVYRGFVPRQI